LSLIWERTKREAGIETPTRSQKENRNLFKRNQKREPLNLIFYSGLLFEEAFSVSKISIGKIS
jgi:hypothetical protein